MKRQLRILLVFSLVSPSLQSLSAFLARSNQEAILLTAQALQLPNLSARRLLRVQQTLGSQWRCHSWPQFFQRYPRMKRGRDLYRWTKGSMATAWYWKRATSPRRLQRAIDASYKHRYIERYRSSRDPEFLLPNIPFWREDPKIAESAKELVTGLLGLVLPGLDFIKAFSILSKDLVRRFMTDRLSRLGKDDPVLVANAMAAIEHAKSLNESRRLFQGYFRKTGYLVTDLILRDFPAFDSETASNEVLAGQREKEIQKLEGYFSGLMRSKKRLISDTKDLEILDFLMRRLNDADPYVVKAAIRAIGVVDKYLLPSDKDALLIKYRHLLLNHPSEVVRGAVARDLSQELVDSKNIQIIEEALYKGDPSPLVEGYLAESLEFLLRADPPRREPDPARYDRLLSLLLERAEKQDLNAPMRKSFLRALVRLRPTDPQTFLRVKRLLMSDPEPTIQDTSAWALASLGAAGEVERQKAVVETLLVVGAGFHDGRRNSHLEHYSLELAQKLAKIVAMMI